MRRKYDSDSVDPVDPVDRPTMAVIIIGRKRGPSSPVILQLPRWVTNLLHVPEEATHPKFLLLGNENTGEVSLFLSTLAERTVEPRLLTLYVNGLCDGEPSEEHQLVQLGLEEAHETDPTKMDKDHVIIPFPFSRLTRKGRVAYDVLPRDSDVGLKDIAQLGGISMASAVKFAKTCVEVGLLTELAPLPARGDKGGRPTKRFSKPSTVPVPSTGEKS